MQDIQTRLQHIYAETLKSSHATHHHIENNLENNLVDQLGIDSIVALELITRVEEEFGIIVDDDDVSLALVDSYATLSSYVSDKLAKSE